MPQSESLSDFYNRVSVNPSETSGNSVPHPENAHFNLFRRNDLTCKNYISYKRRNFYKISLIIGSGTLNYADRGIRINGKALLFSNPNIPYAWEADPVEQTGYFCLFTNGFVNTNYQSENLQTSPLFKTGGYPLYFITLSLHTNHLNKAVKKVTGKTTTEHISARVIQEAQALLKHTDWNISEVAWHLGFESQAYFDQFFRKQTGTTPRSYREE